MEFMKIKLINFNIVSKHLLKTKLLKFKNHFERKA